MPISELEKRTVSLVVNHQISKKIHRLKKFGEVRSYVWKYQAWALKLESGTSLSPNIFIFMSNLSSAFKFLTSFLVEQKKACQTFHLSGHRLGQTWALFNPSVMFKSGALSPNIQYLSSFLRFEWTKIWNNSPPNIISHFDSDIFFK